MSLGGDVYIYVEAPVVYFVITNTFRMRSAFWFRGSRGISSRCRHKFVA